MVQSVVSIVVSAWSPIEFELLLAFSIAEPMEVHVLCFGMLGLHFTSDDGVHYGIVSLDGDGWLFVTHIVENDSRQLHASWCTLQQVWL